MSYDLSNDADPVPGPPLPGISAARLQVIRRWSTVASVFAALVALGWWLVGVYADWLWYDQLGYRYVFLNILVIKTFLFATGGFLAATLLALNISIVLPLALGPVSRPLPPDFLRLVLAIFRLLVYLSLLIVGLTFGWAASQRWELIILLLHQVPFGITDPQFGRDVSFYVVNLGILRFAQSWFLALFITLISLSVFFYASIYFLRGLNFVLTPRTLRHLAALGIFLMLVLAFHHVLSIYELVLSQRGLVTGATYTDVNARIPVYWFLAFIGLLAAVGFGASALFPIGGPITGPISGPGLRLMVGAFSLWLIMFLLAGILFPYLFQRFRVAPDEFAREQPYIQRNLAATRAAYGLESIQETVFPPNGAQVRPSLTQEVAREHRLVTGSRLGAGIRLWDPAPLQAAYNQLQFMELYYNFLNMDSDRYPVDGKVRQVLVGARELYPVDLPDSHGNRAQRWVNQRLQYTHGYGVAMTPANGYTLGEGRPEFYIQDIPIRGAPSWNRHLSRPEVYYGEAPVEFAIVSTGMSEVNPDSENWSYDGTGGVPLSSRFRRMVYSLEFGDVNISLSDQITPGSRIQYRRHIRERVKALAPFLKLDEDPYPVGGRSGEAMVDPGCLYRHRPLPLFDTQ